MRFCLLPLLTSLAAAEPDIISDVALHSTFEKELGKFADAGEYPTGKSLAESVPDLPSEFSLPEEAKTTESTPNLPKDAVYLIGWVYDCGKCDEWHLGSVATAWAISSDGWMITNQHVFAKAKGEVMGVCDRHGRVRPVMEVVAVNEADDTAIFRIEADDLVPLPLGPTAEVGDEVEVISHSNRRFYTHTYGRVSRYFRTPRRNDRAPTVRMSITADYAKGSSGGPVLDAEGRVIGMVCNTQSIYYESDNGQPKGPLQMVLKNCVPVDSIRTLIGITKPPGEHQRASQR